MAELLATKKGDERATFARTEAAALEQRLALIRVEVPPSVRDLKDFELRVDHTPVDPFFLRLGTIAAEPGKHVLEASAPSKRRWTRDVDATVGTATSVKVILEDEASAPATTITAEPSPRRDGSGQRMLGIAIAGAGVVGVGVGTVFGFVAKGKFDDAKKACGTGFTYPTCENDSQGASAKNHSAMTSATVSTIAFAAGGVALAAGAVLYFTAPSAAKTVALAATPGGLDVVGRW
jgi:hypothetical protein